MFRCACRSRVRPGLIRLISITFLAAGFAALLARPAQAQVVAQYTFEDGGTDGWVSFDNASAPVNSTAATAAADPDGGTHSLLTTTNSSGQGGPALQLTGLAPGATYTITGYVMLTPAEAATDANFTVQRQDPGCQGGTCYDTVGQYQVPVTASAWAQIGGTYTVSTTATSLLLYAQLVGPTTAQSFYLDDVTITEVAGPPNGPQDNSGITTTFEDGATDGWSSRSGSSVLTNTAITNGPAGETRALRVTHRVAAWDGPQINVSDKMYVGSSYAISVWVMLGPDATQADTLRVSLQTTLTDPSTGQATTSYYTVVPDTAVPLGQWVRLSIPNYSMAAAYDPGKAYLYVESASGTQDFYITDFKLKYLPPLTIQQNIPSIYKTLAAYFPVGAEIDQSDLAGAHAQLLVKHFDSIVSGNDMKWQETEPTEGHFTYAAADAEVQFAEQHHMLIRGHNLVWSTGAQTPAWVFLEKNGTTPLSASNPADVMLLTERIRNHIKNLVQHFGSAVYVWDVVNEPIDPSEPDCLVHGPFYKVLGARYISIALWAAREYAPPGTQLFINEYGLSNPKRLRCMIRLIRHLRARGVPLDGIGHEMHTHIDGPSPWAQYWSIETLHRLFPRLRQQVTELDNSVYAQNDNTSNYGANGGTVPPALLDEQGWLYKEYFDVFRALKGTLEAVTFWGMADDNTWLDSFPINRLDMPLPFDTRLQAKPAYWGIVDPTHLPGYGLEVALTSRSGPPGSQTWTITATNPSEATAYDTQINRLFLIPMRGDDDDFRGERGHGRWLRGGPRCRARILSPPDKPLPIGNIPAGGSGSVSFTVQFAHCGSRARFILQAPWSSAVYERGVLVAKDLQP